MTAVFSYYIGIHILSPLIYVIVVINILPFLPPDLSCRESGRAGRDGKPSHSLLYYSDDDVSKFQYLIRMQSENSKNDDDETRKEKNVVRKLEQLDEMRKYCMELKCRRNTLVQHFGAKAVDCHKSCDYCNDPQKVEQAMRASSAIKDTRNQSRNGGRGGRGGKGKKGKAEWDGQWNGPHGDFDDEDAIAKDWGEGTMVGGLRVTGPLSVDPDDDDDEPQPKKRSYGGFQKASDVLSKAEAMERRYYGGDIQDSTNAKRNSVNIPDHLIKSLNEASAKSGNTQQKKPPVKVMTSEDHANNIKASQEKLANLAKMKAEREARLKELQAKMNKKAPPPPPPPPPTMSFGRKK